MSAPRCPECRGPVERRGNTLLCVDRKTCREYPDPYSVILLCPQCGEDSWMVKGGIQGDWKRKARGGRVLKGTARIRCKAGHRSVIPLPPELEPQVPRKAKRRRAF